jgi:hypothetical protein
MPSCSSSISRFPLTLWPHDVTLPRGTVGMRAAEVAMREPATRRRRRVAGRLRKNAVVLHLRNASQLF